MLNICTAARTGFLEYAQSGRNSWCSLNYISERYGFTYHTNCNFQLITGYPVDAYIKNVKDMLINPAYLGATGEGGNSWQNGPSLSKVSTSMPKPD